MRAIVDSATMRLLEERAFASGHTAEDFMNSVGKQLSCFILKQHVGAFSIVLLAGKGNNAADGYTTLIELLHCGVSTVAWQLVSPTSGSLLEKKMNIYLQHGGEVCFFPDTPKIQEPTVILDGIYGIGFKGKPDASAVQAILWANSWPSTVVSIDLPSGVDPTTGEVVTEAIYADHTVACHLPKKGCFIQKGWEHCGEITVLDLSIEEHKSDMYVLEQKDIVPLLPSRKRTVNKYQAGHVVAIAGSPGMMGAASLACEAAYRAGAGYVRVLLHEEQASSEIPREVVPLVLNEDSLSWKKWMDRADALLIGPGLGRKFLYRLDELWPCVTGNAVLDADALFWLSQKPLGEWNVQNVVLTPHLGEAASLLNRTVSTVDDSFLQQMQMVARTTQSTIVVKGAPTFIFSAKKSIFVMPRGNPGMATAGTGDILSGLIAGFLAQKLSPLSSSMLATWVHGMAGELSAIEQTSYSMIASSLFEMIPKVLQSLLLMRLKKRKTYIHFGKTTN